VLSADVVGAAHVATVDAGLGGEPIPLVVKRQKALHVGQRCWLIVNATPTTIHGQRSCGIVLALEDAQNNPGQLAFIDVPVGAQIGTRMGTTRGEFSPTPLTTQALNLFCLWFNSDGNGVVRWAEKDIGLTCEVRNGTLA
jgi:hypothetical protein